MKYFSLKVLKHPIANKKRVHLRGQNEINLGDAGVILFSLLLLWFSLYGSQIYSLSYTLCEVHGGVALGFLMAGEVHVCWERGL